MTGKILWFTVTSYKYISTRRFYGKQEKINQDNVTGKIRMECLIDCDTETNG